jgi:hypothetical protein
MKTRTRDAVSTATYLSRAAIILLQLIIALKYDIRLNSEELSIYKILLLIRN